MISKRNRRGVALLTLVATAIVFTPRIFSLALGSKAPEISFKEVVLVNQKMEHRAATPIHGNKNYYSNTGKKYKRPPRKFDPNQYTEEDWKYLGLSEKQAASMVRFCRRKLVSNEELRSAYVLPEELFILIKDSTYYPQGLLYNRERDAVTAYDKSKIYIPLNSANEEELQKVPGIGPYFAKRIVQLRENLGGFIEKEQLLDIPKMDLEKFQAIRNYLELNQTPIKKLKINSATLDELKQHPYISYNVANSIVKIREQKGSYQSIEEIKQSKLIDEMLFYKIKPYLEL